MKVVLLGLHERTFALGAISKHNDKMIVKFTPCGLSAFLKIPLHELNNQLISADDLFGSDILDLHHKLQSATSTVHRMVLVESFLKQRFREPSPLHKMIHSLAHTLKSNANHPSLHNLKSALPLSIRQVERNFKKLTGTDIRGFRRMVRFEKAFQKVLVADFS